MRSRRTMIFRPLRKLISCKWPMASAVKKLNISSSVAVQSQEKDACNEENVLFDNISGGKGLITLNRPKQLNTLNYDMVKKIKEKILCWKEKKYLIVIKGSGEKAFCAGGDVVAAVKDTTGETAKKFFKEEFKMDALISALSVPTVAFISGIVMGGGVGISLFGKYRIATETSLFAMPETQIGFFPDVGVSFRLSRMPNNLGMFLALTSYRLKGYDLVHAGVATHFCSQKNLPELENALLHDFTRACSSSPAEIIQEFHDNSVKELPNGKPPGFTLEPNLKLIDSWFSECRIENALAKIEQDKSKFAQDTLESFKATSPLSLKVTYKQIKEAANSDIYECFNRDYRIASRMHCQGDFVEGVRALLIDKDKKPKWKHEKVTCVKDEEVASFFCTLSEKEELNLPATLYEPSAK